MACSLYPRQNLEVSFTGSYYTVECEYCKWAWEKPHSVYSDMVAHFSKDQCSDVSNRHDYCNFYNIPCL